MAKSFVDTNVFFYTVNNRDPAKQARARALIADLVDSGSGVISSQVIQEFASNAVKKLGLTPDQTRMLCEGFADHSLIKIDLGIVRDALLLLADSSVSYWDACIVAAASQADCKILYSEDLGAGRRFGRLRIVNPFE